MVRRNEARREPVRQEVEQKTDRGVQIAAIIALVACGALNAYTLIKVGKSVIEWYVFAGLIGIAGGKEIAEAVFNRLGGKS